MSKAESRKRASLAIDPMTYSIQESTKDAKTFFEDQEKRSIMFAKSHEADMSRVTVRNKIDIAAAKHKAAQAFQSQIEVLKMQKEIDLIDEEEFRADAKKLMSEYKLQLEQTHKED
jgi:hypothetical protein